MLTTEWNFDDELAVRTMEAREEERKKLKNLARVLIAKGLMSVNEIAETTKLDVNDILFLQGEG